MGRSMRIQHPPLGKPPGLVQIPAPMAKIASKCPIQVPDRYFRVWSMNLAKLRISFWHCSQLFLLQKLFHGVKNLGY